MKILILILAFVCLVAAEENNTQTLVDLGFDLGRYSPDTLEDGFLTTIELAEKYGYNAEIHTVTTEDGYILEMHRVQSRTPQSTQNSKAPILLIHGLQGTSRSWVASGREYGLGYLLADMGYDVWLANCRGNHYSRKHTTLNPDGDRTQRDTYWSFSWHEIGVYDLPAMIDTVLATTGYKKLHYIGYSQGTTAFWIMASEKPEYNEKIIAMHAFAPVAFMTNVTNEIFVAMAPLADVFELVGSKVLGIYEIPANSDLILKSGLTQCLIAVGNEKYECAEKVHLKTIGSYKSIEQINAQLPVAILNVAGGSSTKCLVHYGQLINSGKFRKYDYGLGNLNKYRSSSPPNYKLSDISVPIALYHSGGDKVASIEDVDLLAAKLPNVFDQYLVSDPNFNHVDFIFSPRVSSLLHTQLFQNLQIVNA